MKRYHLTFFAPVFLGLALVALMLFWLLWPYNSLTFGDYYVDREEYRAGQFVQVTVSEFCTDGSPNTNERWLDNEFGGVALPPLRFNGAGEPVCLQNLQFLVKIPDETVPGKYRLEFITKYKANPIRLVEVTTYSPFFYVTK